MAAMLARLSAEDAAEALRQHHHGEDACTQVQWQGYLEQADAVLGYVRRALAAADSGPDLLDHVIEQCISWVAIHSQYPITTDYDRGYARSREQAADVLRTRKARIIEDAKAALAFARKTKMETDLQDRPESYFIQFRPRVKG